MVSSNVIWRLVAIGLLLAGYHQMMHTDLIGIHVWRQTQTQTVINTLAAGDGDIFSPRVLQINDAGSRVLRMEFPVMQWLFAQGQRLWGDSLLVLRLQCLALSLLTLWGISRLAARLFPDFRIAGSIAFWCLAFSPLFYYYAINPLPDNFALCAAVWSLYFLMRFIGGQKSVFWMLHLALLSVAVLAKLPFTVFFAGSLVALASVLRRPVGGAQKSVLLLSLLLLAAPTAWYLCVIPDWQNDGLKGGLFATRTPLTTLAAIAEHHLVSTLPELMVNYASVLAFIVGAVAGVRALRKRPLSVEKKALLAALVAALLYIVYELGMIGKEHDYYLFPLLPFIVLAVVAGYKTLFRLPFSGKWRMLLQGLAVAGLVLSPLTAWLRVQSRWDLNEPGFNADYYRYKDALRTAIPENALVITGPDASRFIHLYYLNCQGWTFTASAPDGAFVADKISKGARFLVADSADAARVLPAGHPVRRFGSLVVAALP